MGESGIGRHFSGDEGKTISDITPVPEQDQPDAQGAPSKTADDCVKQSRPPEKHWLEYGIFLSGIGSIAIACVAAGFSLYQGWVARDTERRSLRAYVFVETGIDEKTPDIDAPGLLTAKITIKNGGITPAYNVTTKLGGSLSSFPKPVASELTPPQNAFPYLSSSTLGPQSHETMSFEGPREFNAAEKAQIHQSWKGVYIYGVIEYQDVFQKFHKCNFRTVVVALKASAKVQWITANEGNDCDENKD